MKGVKFGNYHSFDDFSLILTGKTIQQPSVKTEYVDILGASGRLDLTEYFGGVNYSNRKLSFTFETKLRRQAFYEMFERIANLIHGQRLSIYLDEDPYFYYEGRINVHEYKSNEKVGSIVIEADCEPFKLEEYETHYLFTLNGEITEGVLVNLKKRVTPTVKIDSLSSIKLIYNEITYNLTQGTYVLPELVLEEGNNIIQMEGEGQISFMYRRGKL